MSHNPQPAFIQTLVLLLLPSCCDLCHGALLTLQPVDVGLVEVGDPNTNLALSGSIGVYHYGADEHRSFLKFDLSGIAPEVITSAKLIVSWQSASQFFSSELPIDIRHVSDDSWQTASITWNNQPTTDVLLSTVLFNPDDPSNTDLVPFGISWQLSTQELQGDTADGLLSLAIVVPTSNLGAGVSFRTGEPFGPFLEVTTAAVPEPSSWLIFAIGFLLVAVCRYCPAAISLPACRS